MYAVEVDPVTKEKSVNWAAVSVAYCVSNATVPLIVIAFVNVALPTSVALASMVTDLASVLWSDS